MKSLTLAALAFVLSPVFAVWGANAAVMTFDDLRVGDGISHTYEENGILAVGNGDIGSYARGNLHLDDFGTAASSYVDFSMDSSFDAVGFDLDPFDFEYYLCSPDVRPCTLATYDNVLMQGFVEGNLVASFLFNMGIGTDPFPVLFDDSFKNLTSLRIGVASPPTTPAGYTSFCSAPCSHFSIDNLVLSPVALSPVPVPAGMSLGGIGILILSLMAFRQRRVVALRHDSRGERTMSL